MKSYGMPVGPITLSDEVGIDISNHVGSFMSKADLGVRMHGGNPDYMKAMVEKGMLGRKTGTHSLIHSFTYLLSHSLTHSFTI